MVVVRVGNIAPVLSPRLGSDCSGSHGTKNRTLSISSVAAQEIIFVQGSYLYLGLDYTKATVGGVTQYTFLNRVYDNFHIRIYHWS